MRVGFDLHIQQFLVESLEWSNRFLKAVFNSAPEGPIGFRGGHFSFGWSEIQKTWIPN